MDIIRYFELKKRMTNGCKLCNNCPLSTQNNNLNRFCIDFEYEYPEKAVEIVEKWAEKHPVKTRQSELLKLFPNAPRRKNGSLAVCPAAVDATYQTRCNNYDCEECSKDYWLTKVGDE